MATSNITVMTCDRCGHVEEIRNYEKLYNWGKLAYAQVNGPKFNVKPNLVVKEALDVCPSCLNALHDWWTKGTKTCS